MARAGQFRERAQVQRQGDAGSLDAYGNPTAATWTDLETVWVDLRETPGREAIAAGRLEAPATGTVRLRKSATASAITAADRMILRGHTWAITGGPVDPEGRGRILEFLVARNVATE